MSTIDRADKQSRIRPVPEGYHTASPYLIAANAAAALEFYRTAFGATVKRRLAMPDGKIMHAEMKIGDSIVMLADEFPSHEAFGPEHFGGSPSLWSSMWKMPIRFTLRRSGPARPRFARWRINHSEIAPALFAILSATVGHLPLTSKISPMRRSSGASRR